MSRSAKFDRVVVAELTCSFLEMPASATVKAAFVSSTTGQTHGWTTGRSWSPATVEKLLALKASMENDLNLIHFGEGVTTETALSKESQPMHIEETGLGEFIGNTVIPQT